MNYVSALYAIVFTVALVDWFIRGRKHFNPPSSYRDVVQGVPGQA